MKHIYNLTCTLFILLAVTQLGWSQCSINASSSITCGLTDVDLSVNNPGSYSYSWDLDNNGTIDFCDMDCYCDEGINGNCAEELIYDAGWK